MEEARVIAAALAPLVGLGDSPLSLQKETPVGLLLETARRRIWQIGEAHGLKTQEAEDFLKRVRGPLKNSGGPGWPPHSSFSHSLPRFSPSPVQSSLLQLLLLLPLILLLLLLLLKLLLLPVLLLLYVQAALQLLYKAVLHEARMREARAAEAEKLSGTGDGENPKLPAWAPSRGLAAAAAALGVKDWRRSMQAETQQLAELFQ